MRKYSYERGFLLEPAIDYMPGVFINSMDDMIGFMKDTLEKRGEYASDRMRVNHIINRYQDGENCKRVLEKIGMDSEYDKNHSEFRKSKFAKRCERFINRRNEQIS